MRNCRLIVACVVVCALGGCAARPKLDTTVVTNSPLPSMQGYNGYIGKDYWVSGDLLQLCDRATRLGCSEFLQRGTHLKVDGLVSNHTEAYGISSDAPYYHIVTDDGRSGFVDPVPFPATTTTIDPAVGAAECKKKGDPRLGMNAAQVKATCWGPPQYVNTK